MENFHEEVVTYIDFVIRGIAKNSDLKKIKLTCFA